jgi:competence protein ComEC
MGKTPLVSFTLALISGLFLSEAFLYFPLILCLVISIFLLLELAFCQARLLSLPLLLTALAGFLIHQFTAMPISKHDLRHYIDQNSLRITARVSGALRHDTRRVTLPMEAQTIVVGDKVRRIQGSFQLNIWEREISFEYGDLLEMEITLGHPRQFQNPGAFQYADYRERAGWSGTANLSNLERIRKLGEGGNPFIKRIFRWRDEIRHRILDAFKGPEGALLMALVIGETGYLPDEVREQFAASGTAHLLAVSGAHLAFVSLFVFGAVRIFLLKLPEAILLRLTLWKIPSQWAALVTALSAVFYTLLAGAKMGTLRALTMILVYLLSIWMSRNRDVRATLAFAALLIILFKPRAVFEISFQLSFLSVLFIILIMDWQHFHDTVTFEEGTEKKPSWYRKVLVEPVSLMMLSTIGATIGTLPLSLYYFHQFAWVGLISNLIVLPLVAWLVIPMGLISSIVSLLFSVGFRFVAVHEQVLSLFYGLITLFSKFPGADGHFPSPPLWLIVWYYVTVVVMILLRKNWKPCVSVLLCFVLGFFGWGRIRIPPDHLRVTFLDVAQGDATLIEFSNGKTMLIDAGTETAGKSGVAPYLWEQHISTIDILLASHPQFDHIGGLPYLMRTFTVGEVWSNGRDNHAAHYQDFLKIIDSNGLRHLTISNQLSPITIDGCTLTFLNPAKADSQDGTGSFDSPNNDSIVLHLSCPTSEEKSLSFLFSGDIEAEAEQALIKGAEPLRSQVLKVPHHGSQSSSGLQFISAVSPEIAIISAGQKNRYRHPHGDVVAAYENFGTKIYRSDQDGSISIELKPEQQGSGLPLQVSTYRDGRIKKIDWSAHILKQEWNNVQAYFRQKL